SPQRAIERRELFGELVPQSEDLAVDRVAREALLVPQDRALPDPVRKRGVDLTQLAPELLLVTQVEAFTRGELDIEHVVRLARGRLLAKHGEDLAVVGRTRRGSHAEDEGV